MSNPTKEPGDEPRCTWRVALPVSYKTSTVLLILSSPVKVLLAIEERTNLRKNWNYEWEMRERSVMIASCQNKMLGFLASCHGLLGIMPGTNSYICCSVTMVWVQIPSREEQKFDSSKI